jgi:hypothetical protein
MKKTHFELYSDRIAHCYCHHRYIGGYSVSVFARARENARRASCQSNLTQIGLGVAQYSQEIR